MKKSVIMLLTLVLIGTLGVMSSYAGNRNQGATCPNDCTGTCPADVTADTEDLPATITITIAPNTLVLGLQGTWVTVHTNIPYSSVQGSSVVLEEIPAASTFADNRGNLVAKFNQDEVEAIVAPPQETLTLTGTYDNGDLFSGSDSIVVQESGNNQ